MKKSKKLITRCLQTFLKKFFKNTLYQKYVFLKTKRKFKKKINEQTSYEKFSSNLDKINLHEYKKTSQNNEDGIIEYIFKKVPNNKYFIEIGFGYYEFNSLNLIKQNWSGKLVDINEEEVIALKQNLDYFFPKHSIKILNKKVSKNNIKEILKTNNPKQEIDFFSLDVDSNDYWLLKELNLENVKVICCEYNHWLGNKEKLTIKYDENFKFQDNGIWGASLLSISELLNKKGFSLIAVESSGTNSFFVNKKYNDLFEILSPEKSYKSVGRFYNSIKKNEIFENVRKNQDKLIKV